MTTQTDRMGNLRPGDFEEESMSRLDEVIKANHDAHGKRIGADWWQEFHLEQISISLAIIADALTERKGKYE